MALEGFVNGHLVPYALADHNGENCEVEEHLRFMVAERVRDSISQRAFPSDLSLQLSSAPSSFQLPKYHQQLGPSAQPQALRGSFHTQTARRRPRPPVSCWDILSSQEAKVLGWILFPPRPQPFSVVSIPLCVCAFSFSHSFFCLHHG